MFLMFLSLGSFSLTEKVNFPTNGDVMKQFAPSLLEFAPSLLEFAPSLLELIRRTSAELPDDVVRAIEAQRQLEVPGSQARYALDIIAENIVLAKEKSQPLCQDTGAIIFYIKAPIGLDQQLFSQAARNAVVEATEKGYLRQNSVEPLTGKNTGNNLGPGFPTFHFEQHEDNQRKDIDVRLILKGGGCENCGAQYSLPNRQIEADRNLDGVKRSLLDCVIQAQGKGCAPGILGVCIGGDRATGYVNSKEQLLRRLDDTNPDSKLAQLESDIVRIANELGIGPMGFGGKTTLLGCKIGVLNRLPASYFVSITYMCWAYRRQGVLLNEQGRITQWIY
jgi:fumarate hydratase class I